MGQKNTDAAFDALYCDQRHSITRLCMLYLHDEALAEDAAQETFYKVYKGMHGFRRRSELSTWVTRIAVNTCKDILRKHQPLSLDALSEEPRLPADDRDDRLSLTAAIAALPPKNREVVILYYYRELSQKAIARVLGVSEAAVAKRLERARAQLKDFLGEDFYE